MNRTKSVFAGRPLMMTVIFSTFPKVLSITAPWASGRQFFAPGDTTIGNE
jgi:hypothetical protein